MFQHLKSLRRYFATFIPLLLIALVASAWPTTGRESAALPVRVPLTVSPWATTFSPDGKTIATLTWDHAWSLYIRDFPTGTLLAEVDGGRRQAGFAAFSPDGKRLAFLMPSPSLDEPPLWIRLWDISFKRELIHERLLPLELPYSPRAVPHFAFSPDGKTLAAGTPQGIIYLWETVTGRVRARFHGGVAVNFPPDDVQTLVAVTHDGWIRRFTLPSCQPIGPVQPGTRTDYLYVTRVVFSPSGKLVALGDEWTTLVKDVATNRTLCRVNLPMAAAPGSFASDDKFLAVTCDDGTRFIDTSTGQERAWLPYKAEFLGDSKHLACHEEAALVLRDTASVLAGKEKAPEPAKPDTPGVALEAELVAKESSYRLDLEGNTPADYSARIQFGNEFTDEYPDSLRVKLALRIHNKGTKPVTLRYTPPNCLDFHLVGSGAINHSSVDRQVAGPAPEPTLQRLAPGGSCTIRITDLGSDVRPFWVLPGEYALVGEFSGQVSPAPAGSDDAPDGFGYLTLKLAPAKVQVLPESKPRHTKPWETEVIILRTPPPGTVFIPKAHEGAKRMREKLDKPINLDRGFNAGRSLKDALEFFNDRYDIDFHIDEAAFKTIGKERIKEAKTDLRPLMEVSFGCVLHLLLDQVDANFEIRQNALWIVPAAKSQCLAERLGWALKHLRKSLNKSVTLGIGIPAGTSLGSALDDLSKRAELNLYLDTKAFERAGMKNIAVQPVKLDKAIDLAVGSVLKALLDPIGATFVLRDNVVLIVPKRKQ